MRSPLFSLKDTPILEGELEDSNTMLIQDPESGAPMTVAIEVLRDALTESINSRLDALERTFAGTGNSFEYIQTEPQRIWDITHDLNRYPAITILDASGLEVEALVTHTSKNNTTIEFSEPLIGTVTFS